VGQRWMAGRRRMTGPRWMARVRLEMTSSLKVEQKDEAKNDLPVDQ